MSIFPPTAPLKLKISPIGTCRNYFEMYVQQTLLMLMIFTPMFEGGKRKHRKPICCPSRSNRHQWPSHLSLLLLNINFCCKRRPQLTWYPLSSHCWTQTGRITISHDQWEIVEYSGLSMDSDHAFVRVHFCLRQGCDHTRLSHLFQDENCPLELGALNMGITVQKGSTSKWTLRTAWWCLCTQREAPRRKCKSTTYSEMSQPLRSPLTKIVRSDSEHWSLEPSAIAGIFIGWLGVSIDKNRG